MSSTLSSWLFCYIFTVLISVMVLCYYTLRFNFWKRKNVPHLTPSIPLGNLTLSSFKIALHEYLKTAYDTMKANGHKHFGYFAFSKPVYVPMHPEYIEAVLTKDFVDSYDREFYSNENDDSLRNNLLSLEGKRRKKLRAKVSSGFPSSETNIMFENMLSCANMMLQALDQSGLNVIDIKKTSAGFTTDVIESCVSGIGCSIFDENVSEFRRQCRKLYDTSRWLRFKTIVISIFVNLAKMFRITVIGEGTTGLYRNVVPTSNTEENVVVKNDFLQLLMELLRGQEEELFLDEATAQTFWFFSAGFETSSIAISFSIYELAKRPDVQNRVRKEIRQILESNNGIFTYENVMEMQYLDQVVKETLRLHPSVPTIPRICTKYYELPDGKGEIEEGTYVFVPVFALHRDPEFYPNPDEFDPERFSAENNAKRHPCEYLPFGEGPRTCIGQKFGLLQIKIALASLLNSYSFTLNRSSKYNFRYDRRSTFLRNVHPIWVNLEPVK